MARLERAASTSQMWRPTNWATPGYSISVIIPRRRGKSKIFLSVVIPVVKATFIPLSAIEENPTNAGVARLAAYRLTLSRIQPQHSQSRRTAPGGAFRQGNCAAPGQVLFYYTITREKCKWEWRGKCARLGTSESIGSGAQWVFCPS